VISELTPYINPTQHSKSFESKVWAHLTWCWPSFQTTPSLKTVLNTNLHEGFRFQGSRNCQGESQSADFPHTQKNFTVFLIMTNLQYS